MMVSAWTPGHSVVPRQEVNYNFALAPRTAESSTRTPVYLDTQGIVAAVRPGDNIAVWRYIPTIDIDNDGRADNVILWRTSNPPIWNQCGQALDGNRVNLEGPTAFYLTADNSDIDVNSTLTVFDDLISPKYRYYPLKYSIGIFQYRGEYYFDAFVDGEVGKVPTDSSRPAEDYSNYLHVFHRKDGRLEHSCQFVNSDLAYWRGE